MIHASKLCAPKTYIYAITDKIKTTHSPNIKKILLNFNHLDLDLLLQKPNQHHSTTTPKIWGQWHRLTLERSPDHGVSTSKHPSCSLVVAEQKWTSDMKVYCNIKTSANLNFSAKLLYKYIYKYILLDVPTKVCHPVEKQIAPWVPGLVHFAFCPATVLQLETFWYCPNYPLHSIDSKYVPAFTYSKFLCQANSWNSPKCVMSFVSKHSPTLLLLC